MVPVVHFIMGDRQRLYAWETHSNLYTDIKIALQNVPYLFIVTAVFCARPIPDRTGVHYNSLL